MIGDRQVEFQTFRLNLDNKTSYSDLKNNRIRQKILSLCVSGAKSANAIVKVKFKEGDELILWPGRVVHLSQPTTEAIFSWEAQTGEYLDIEISDKVLFPSSDFAKQTSLVSNIPSNKVSKLVMVYYAGYAGMGAQTQLVQANPNRIRCEIESFSDLRHFLGGYNDTIETLADSVLREKNQTIMPYCKKIIDSSDEIYALTDLAYLGPSAAAYPISSYMKVTEFLK